MLSKIDANTDLKKEFTVNSFLTNPTGDTGQTVGNRKLVLEDIRHRMQGLIKSNKPFKHSYYSVGKDVYIKIQVPSETFNGFAYDVIVKFKDADLSTASIMDSNIELFSNSPSFVYSYAYVFNFFKVFITELKGKIDEKAFKDLPAVRNPDAVIFYEKTVTMALIYIKDNSLAASKTIKDAIIKLPLAKFKDAVVKSSNEKQAEYNILKKAESDKKRAESAAKRGVAQKGKKSINLDDKKKAAPKQATKGLGKVNNKLDTKINNKIDNKVKGKANNKVK